MPLSFSPPVPTAAVLGACSLSESDTVSRRASEQQVVGQDRLSHIAEDRLDALIRRLGEQSAEAMAQGDPHGARLYSEQMCAAIASRSPAHQARLYAELEKRINEGADYFAWQGRLDAERLRRHE